MNPAKMFQSFLIIPICLIIGILVSALLRKKRYRYKKIKILFIDFLNSLFFLFTIACMDTIYNGFFNDLLSDYQFGLVFKFLFVIGISLAAFIGVFIAIGYKTIELKKKLKLLKQEKLLFDKIKIAIKSLPDKRLFNLNEAEQLLSINKVTILKYERDLIKFTTIYSKFGDDIFTKEELELFIICHYLITKKGYELPQLKSKIIDYAKKFTDLNYFKKLKNPGILFNQETSRTILTNGKTNHY